LPSTLEKVGASDPAEFAARYDKAARDRDDAIRQLGIQRTINETLGSRAKELESKRSSLAEELEESNQRLAKYEKDAKDLPSLRERLANLQESHDRQKLELEELSPWLNSEDGKKALSVQNELVRTRYLAYGGWGCSALLGLALAAAYFYLKPLTDEVHENLDRPPHQIL
jgi:hypothetical protein